MAHAIATALLASQFVLISASAVSSYSWHYVFARSRREVRLRTVETGEHARFRSCLATAEPRRWFAGALATRPVAGGTEPVPVGSTVGRRHTEYTTLAYRAMLPRRCPGGRFVVSIGRDRSDWVRPSCTRPRGSHQRAERCGDRFSGHHGRTKLGHETRRCLAGNRLPDDQPQVTPSASPMLTVEIWPHDPRSGVGDFGSINQENQSCTGVAHIGEDRCSFPQSVPSWLYRN